MSLCPRPRERTHRVALPFSVLQRNMFALPKVTAADAERLAVEIARGVHLFGALPWLSIESTNDRGAARVVALHPCYRY